MKTKIINEDNLTFDQIDSTSTRVKVFLLNSNNEILVATTDTGCIQLPGGHQEDGENLIDTIIREIKEETGIILTANSIGEPFFEIKHLTQNYRNTRTNRLSQILYFLVRTNEEYNANNIHLTQHEESNGFKINKISILDLENKLIDTIANNEIDINKTIAKETLEAFHTLQIEFPDLMK